MYQKYMPQGSIGIQVLVHDSMGSVLQDVIDSLAETYVLNTTLITPNDIDDNYVENTTLVFV